MTIKYSGAEIGITSIQSMLIQTYIFKCDKTEAIIYVWPLCLDAP